MPFRLYMDEDSLHATVLEALRRAGFDCLTTAEPERRRTPDDAQLQFAHERGRVIARNTADNAGLHTAGSEKVVSIPGSSS